MGESGTDSDCKKVVPESGTLRKSLEQASDWKKNVPKSGTQWESLERVAIVRKLYRNPVRNVRVGIGCDRKKNVPESGTSWGNRKQVLIGRKTYRNPIRCGRVWNRQRSEEKCTGIRYVIEKIENEWKRIRIWCVFLRSKKEKTWLII